MSLSVKHLNGDTTFLLTLKPTVAPDRCRDKFPGSFVILVDPWLVGSSSVWTPRFQISHHTKLSCISSLADLPEPDLILISQDKPDHCHKETLCSLPRNSRINILATPAAAKRIRSWRHFECANIQTISPYSSKRSNTIHSIALPPYTSRSEPGHVTISFIPEKRDMTGLHNAFGITYRPPGTVITTRAGAEVKLPLTPPISPQTTPPFRPKSAGSSVPIDSVFNWSPSKQLDSPDSSRPSSAVEEKIVSVIYAPHGISYSTLSPYIQNHLVPQDALPLTALFHCINVELNPWYLGGRVQSGFPGGMDIAKRVGAKYWISAHDEVKDNRGWATVMIKSRHYTVDDAQNALDDECGREISGDGYGFTLQRKTTIVDLEVGEELRAYH